MKTVARISKVGFFLLIVVALTVHGLVVVCTWPSSDGISTLAGYKVLHVISGSMEPVLRIGDIILVRPLLPEEEIQEGDVITFWTPEGTTLITHRVVGVVAAGDEPTGYVTKGDANANPDAARVFREQVVGRCVIRIPRLGYLSRWVRRPVGILPTVLLPLLLLSRSGILQQVHEP